MTPKDEAREMHELTKSILEWMTRNATWTLVRQNYVNPEQLRYDLRLDFSRLESEVLLPYLKEHDDKVLSNHFKNYNKDWWGIEKRREQALWLKDVLAPIKFHPQEKECIRLIDQAFGLEKSLEDIVTDMMIDRENKTGSTSIERIKNQANKIIQTIKSHYGIKE